MVHMIHMFQVTWFSDHAIICSLVTNKKQYIFSSISPMNTKLDSVVTYDMEPPPKSHCS